MCDVSANRAQNTSMASERLLGGQTQWSSPGVVNGASFGRGLYEMWRIPRDENNSIVLAGSVTVIRVKNVNLNVRGVKWSA